MMFWGPYAWLVIPGLLIGLYAQFRLMSVYGKYSRITSATGLTGAQAAREILDSAGLSDIPVAQVGGHLTDHFDPSKRALFLSPEVFQGNSLASVGVAAHEAGHALQQQASYAPMNLRMMIVPVTQIASTAWIFILIAGMVLGSAVFGKLIWLAVIAFAIVALFNLITLPVEFDASRRAKVQLVRLGIVQGGESQAVAKVLNAAALTYVAALVTSLLHLLRLFLIARDRN